MKLVDYGDHYFEGSVAFWLTSQDSRSGLREIAMPPYLDDLVCSLVLLYRMVFDSLVNALQLWQQGSKAGYQIVGRPNHSWKENLVNAPACVIRLTNLLWLAIANIPGWSQVPSATDDEWRRCA